MAKLFLATTRLPQKMERKFIASLLREIHRIGGGGIDRFSLLVLDS